MILLAKNSWRIKDTKDKGKGVFAKKDIKSRKIIAQYTGWIIPFTELDLKTYGNYIMQYDDEYAIVPDLKKTGAHVINHSCDPNCWIFPQEKNIFFVSVRDIKAHEELTIHYLYPPLDLGCKNCSHICTCRNENCTGTMHTEKKLYEWWQKYLSYSLQSF